MVGQGVRGVAAVQGIAGETAPVAQIFPSGAAITALSAGPPDPRHANAVPDLKAIDSRALGGHDADDFVSGNQRQLGRRQLAVNYVQIGPAHAASPDLEEDLVGSRGGHWKLGEMQWGVRAVQKHGMHRPVLSDSLWGPSPAISTGRHVLASRGSKVRCRPLVSLSWSHRQALRNCCRDRGGVLAARARGSAVLRGRSERSPRA